MRKMVIGLTLLISSAVLAATTQSLNVKTGLWEASSTVTMSGQLPVSADELAKLTPEQREKMEAALKSMAGTRTITYKSCVTKEKLAKGMTFDKSNCTWTTFSSTSTRADMVGVCTEENVKANVSLHLVVVSPENIAGSSQISASGGGHTMNSSSVIRAKWINSECGKVK